MEKENTRDDIRKIIDELYDGDNPHLGIRTLSIDVKKVDGFYTHDLDDLKELSAAIVGCDIVMEMLTSEQINKLLDAGKRVYGNAGIMKLKYVASCLALLTLLAFKRIDYLYREMD